MRTRWSLIAGTVVAAVFVPFALVAVPEGPDRGTRITVWALLLTAVVLLAWRPLRNWWALPVAERRASARAAAVAVPAALALSAVLNGVAVGFATWVLLGDGALALRAAVVNPVTPESAGYLVVLAVPLLWALRPPTVTTVVSWCARRGLPTTTDAVSLAQRDLFSVRAWRTIGAVTGVAIGYGPAMAYNRLFSLIEPTDPAHDALTEASNLLPGLFRDPLTLAMSGYVLGALIAEARRRSARPSTRPAAALDARRVGTYTAPLARWLPAGTASLLVVVAAVRAAIGEGADSTATSPMLVGQAALTAVVLAVVATGLRAWIVRRPQRAADVIQLAVDDAFRASAVHAVTGAISAVIVVYTLLGLQALLDVAGVSQTVGNLVGSVLGIAGIVLVIGLWLGFGSSYAWSVSRATERDGRDQVEA
jgi:hypothetical protein